MTMKCRRLLIMAARGQRLLFLARRSLNEGRSITIR
jgi:hypothetical protein